MIPLDCGQEFDPAREQEFFTTLPSRPAVFLIEPRQRSAQPYLLRTADLRRRLERLLRVPEAPSKRLNLRESTARIRYRLTGSAFEQNLLFYQHARHLYPRRYRDIARIRPAPLLKISLANEYPRCYVTRRIAGSDSMGRIADGSFYFGPFASRRGAGAFASEFLNLFKIRRCHIRIRRDPTFPGCMYSEMKMCLAPCFAGCSKEQYDGEVGRVISFLSSNGASLTTEIEREREAASASLDFERASLLHRRLEKVSEVLRGLPELARRVDELDAVILQPAAEENTIAVFQVRSGMIADPFFLRFDELASQPRSVEEILREKLRACPGNFQGLTEPQPNDGAPPPLQEQMLSSSGMKADAPRGAVLGEHLALLARWFYSKPRQGEIFFARRSPRSGGPAENAAGAEANWPYRRIIRACSRLLAPQISLPFAPDQQRASGKMG